MQPTSVEPPQKWRLLTRARPAQRLTSTRDRSSPEPLQKSHGARRRCIPDTLGEVSTKPNWTAALRVVARAMLGPLESVYLPAHSQRSSVYLGLFGQDSEGWQAPRRARFRGGGVHAGGQRATGTLIVTRDLHGLNLSSCVRHERGAARPREDGNLRMLRPDIRSAGCRVETRWTEFGLHWTEPWAALD